jgi:hypothetical protein
MHSNPQCKSVTRYITALKPLSSVYSSTRDVYLADSPGIGDTAGIEVEIANMIGVMRALQQTK